MYYHGTHTIQKTPVNRLMQRDTYLHRRYVYRYQRILPYPLKDIYTNLKLLVFKASVYIAEIPSLLPKIPVLPNLAYFGQLYFSLTKNIPALIGWQLTWLGHAHQSHMTSSSMTSLMLPPVGKLVRHVLPWIFRKVPVTIQVTTRAGESHSEAQGNRMFGAP